MTGTRNKQITQIDEAIRSRRAVYPHMYSDAPIADEEIWEVLESANWAPTHKKTEPWRFRVFRDAARVRLADFLAARYKEMTPAKVFSEIKHHKTYEKVMQSQCVIAICMRRDPQKRLPEWEELAAVACAVQNMWLSCTARGIGAYWSTPASILQAPSILELAPHERCYGLFYMGRTDAEIPAQTRGAIADKVVWYDQ